MFIVESNLSNPLTFPSFEAKIFSQPFIVFKEWAKRVGYSDDSGLLHFLPHLVLNRLLCVWDYMRSWLVKDVNFTSL